MVSTGCSLEELPMLVRSAISTVLLAAAIAGHAHAADAGTPYPTRPVRLILGYPPGGASDAVARILVQPLPGRLGQQVVIDNRPGAGGNIAAEIAARSAPDGHTWFLGNNAILATNQALYERLPFDSVRDFATVVLVGTQPSVLVVHPSLPAKSVRDVVALAKARPGQLNYASTGTGTAGHLVGELFKSLTKVSFVHIPYKGGGPAVIDLVSGQVHFMFATAASVMQHVRSGRLRALAVTSAKRSPSLPDLPTVAEAGVPGFEAINWHGIVVPAATPAPVIAKINAELTAVLGMSETRERLGAQGVEPKGGTPAEFATYLRSEIPKWTKVVRDSGAKAD
jgi:tripartite-type tricarboxylate transporter receptor subunit TctC